MYTQGSVEFNELIETPNNQALVKRLILTDDNTEIENIISIVMHSSSSQDELQIGTTNMSYIEVVAVTDKVLTNREVRLECGVKLSNGTIEYAPMGVFTIQKPKGDLDRITFTANDKMQKLEKPYTSSLTYPTTSNKVLAELCNMCGVELATPIDTPITIATKLDGYTCREMLGYISGIHAKFAFFDRLGKLNLRWYSNTPIEKKIGLIYNLSKAERNFTVDKVEVAKDSETKYTSGDGLGVVYYSNPLATQDITNKIFNNIDGFAYNASTIEILDDIRLDLGDVIKVTYLDGIDYLVPCMSLKQDFAQGSTSIEAYSKTDEENEYRYTGPTTKYIERVAHELLLANRIIATKVDADYVQSHAITTDNLDAIQANITTLVVEEIDGRYANLDFANIDVANINVAKMGELFAKVGLIDRATIKDGHITGYLDAVEINANKITAGTLMVDRLVFRGSEESIIYELNNIKSNNLLPYPYNTTTKTINGITFTDNGDGTITVNGTATAQATFTLTNPITVDDDSKGLEVENGQTYTLSGCPSGGSASTYSLYNNYIDKGEWKNFGRDTGNGLTFVGNGKKAMFMIRIGSGTTVNNLTFKPMLTKGSEVLPYEPFRERTQALTSETINGEVLTDRTITADKIIAKSITTNELDVNQIFGNTAVLNTIVSQDIFAQAIATNSLVVGAYGVAEEAIEKVNKTVKSITMHYLATTASSGVTTSTSGWTTTVQQIDATKKYLWTYQTITYADNTITDTSPVISGVYGNEGKDGKDGEDGTNGVGITSVVPLYYLKSNTTTPSAPTSAVTSTATSSGVWTKSVPTYVTNYTYFTCTQTQYTNGTYGWSTVVADNALTNANKTATTANATANTANTNASNAVSTANTANSTANTASTNATNALNRATYHYGTCSTAAGTAAKVVTLSGFVLYTGAQVTVQFSKANTAANPTLNVNSTGAKNIRVNNANITSKYYWSANNTVTFVYNGTYWVMSDTSANTIIANWCSSNDVTYIDGGKIYTGSITADKINVIDLFSQSIIATGSITGAKLYGTYAEIEGGKIGGFTLSENRLVATNSEGNEVVIDPKGDDLRGCSIYVYSSIDGKPYGIDKAGNIVARGMNVFGSADFYNICNFQSRIRVIGSATFVDTVTAPTFSGALTGNVTGNADTATKVYSTLTNPTSAKTYSLPFHTGATSDNKSLLNNDGIRYRTLEGTTSENGYGILYLGNDVVNGTAANKYGAIRMYGTGAYYTQLRGLNATANRTINFPDASGTLALTTSTVENANKLGGKSLLAKNSTDTWDGIPFVDDKGVMEIGKYIDFHTTDGNTADYDVRITATTDGLAVNNNVIINNNKGYYCKDSSGTNQVGLLIDSNDITRIANSSLNWTVGSTNSPYGYLYAKNLIRVSAPSLRIGGADTAGESSTGVMVSSTGGMSISGATPTIDFHYNNSTTRTAYISETVAGVLTANTTIQAKSFKFGSTYDYYLSESGDISARTVSQTSDRNDKKDIEDISAKYLELWDKLTVKLFKYINDAEEKVRVGLIAQEVEECALKSGLSLEQCGFILREYVDNEIYKGYKYSLDYTGLATITMAKLKQVIGNITEHDKRIQKLEDEIAILKATINQMQMQYA